MTGWGLVMAGVLVATLTSACASSAATPRGGRAAPDARPPSPPKRIVTVIQGDPHTLYQKMNPSNHIPGIDNLELVVNGPLAQEDKDGVMQLHLAESIPFVESGSWRVFPDGRMETTWKLKRNLVWHDGA